MSQIQTIKTAIHEMAHAKLHGSVPEENGQESSEVLEKTRETKEVEAESVAYTICQRYGIETSDYSFGYIAGWSSGNERIKKLAGDYPQDISRTDPVSGSAASDAGRSSDSRSDGKR